MSSKVEIILDDEIVDIIVMLAGKMKSPTHDVIIHLIEMGLDSCVNIGIKTTVSAQGDNGGKIN